jgi:outer membrane murein-binding lipoprotein Lpp
MKLMPKLSKIVLIAIAVNILMFCGCSKNKKNDEQQAKQMKATDKSDKVPEDLETLESSIEKIIKTLNGPSVSLKDEKKQTGGQNQEQSQGQSQSPSPQKSGQGGGQESGQQSGQQSQGGEQTQSQGQKTSQPTNGTQSNQNTTSPPKDPWQEISSTVHKLHYQWNGYQPSATKKNANRQLVDNFSNALNTLTSTTLTKDRNKTLLAANNLYLYVPDFYMLYKTETSPEIKRIRYYARNVVLNASTLNWDQAGKDIISLKVTWAIYKNIIDPKNQDLSSKLDYSIYELEKVVTEKNQSLTDIKGRITISNTEGLEKAAKGSQEKG